MMGIMIHSLFHKNNLNITHEDTITSTIIGTMLYLSDHLFWKVLRSACYENKKLPENLGELQEYVFWPKWNPKGTENTNYVEPDVFLRFSNKTDLNKTDLNETDLILEAKRSDDGGQYLEEWERELTSYGNTFGETKVPVFLIAIGGNGNVTSNKTMTVNGHERMIVKCSWMKLYEALREEQEKLTGNNLRVVESLLLACDLFGIRSYQWLDAKPWLSEYEIAIPKESRTLIFKE